MVNKQSTQSRTLLLALIVLIGLNLRPFLVAIGPVMVRVMNDTGLSYGQASLLTLLPMFIMGIGAFWVVALPINLAGRHQLLLALALLFAGNLLRLYADNGTILIATAIMCGIAVAIAQSIIPGIIKQHFYHHTASATGVYSASLMIGGALGAQSMPLLSALDYTWQQALSWLALPCLLVLIATAVVFPREPSPAVITGTLRHLITKPRSWSLIAHFGIINGAYATLVTWLASYYQQRGWDAEHSSQLIVILAVCQATFALGLPALIKGYTDRRPWMIAMLILQATGFFGLMCLPDTTPFLWAGACGAGLGGAFSLAILVSLDHFDTPQSAGMLAAIMQGGGFMLASLFPLLFAQLVRWAGDYTYGWGMHFLMIMIAVSICLRFNPKRYALAMGQS